MFLSTTRAQIEQSGLFPAPQNGLPAAAGYKVPQDVLEDGELDLSRKRAILAAWASDASAVQDEPTLRWLLGAPDPVPLVDILDALASLDSEAVRRP